MSYLRKIEGGRSVNRVVELQRKVQKAAARRAGLQYRAHLEAERRFFSALRTMAGQV